MTHSCFLRDALAIFAIVAVFFGELHAFAQNPSRPPRGEELKSLVLAKAKSAGIRDAKGGLAEILAHLARVPESFKDVQLLPTIESGFTEPLNLNRSEGALAERVSEAKSGELSKLFALIGFALHIPIEARDKDGPPKYMASQNELEFAQSLAKDLLWNIAPPDENLVKHLAFIVAAPDLSRKINTNILNAETHIKERRQLLVGHAKNEPLLMSTLPQDLANAVTGEILFFNAQADGTFSVAGGAGDNSYDMSRISSVLDIGGNDTYRFSAPAGAPCPNHLVFDLAGEDHYVGESAFCGPGAAQFGFSLVDDRSGNDRYSSTQPFSMAAGLFGVGMVIDRAGDDRYENSGSYAGWAQGSALYGAGILLDQAGNDQYIAQRFSQGAGGPSGFGVVIDVEGQDLYRANGRDYPSVYGDHWVYSGMSQGFGFGIRKFAPGGIGGMYDFAGNDRYEGGEFTQASAYYWGLGILHDYSGSDLYYANRFGQSAGAHRALSILVDEEGNDAYWGMTSSSQAGPWDESVAFLIDKGGDDSYRCEELCQGAAAQQSLGILLDLSGNDHYNAASTHVVGGAQGAAGKNSYHYQISRVFSFGALFDLGHKSDAYSSQSSNNSVLRVARPNTEDLGESEQFGLFVDE